MTSYTVELSEAENLALSYVAKAQQDWIDNAVHERCRVAMDEIIALEVKRCMADGTPIPSNRDATVQQAFARGTVKSAAQIDAELRAESAAFIQGMA